MDKIRLLMVYIVSQEGIKETDRKRLMDLAKISMQDQACISNLRYLNVTLSRPNKAVKKQKLDGKKKKKNADDAPPFELSRYVPAIKKIGEVSFSVSFPYNRIRLVALYPPLTFHLFVKRFPRNNRTPRKILPWHLRFVKA